MLHFMAIGLSGLLLFGTAVAPCSLRTDREEEVSYRDSAVIYDDKEYSLTAMSTTSYTVDYISYEYTKHDLALFFPRYTFSPMAGSCAPIGGANVLGFYDRFDENLIPNHTSGRAVGSWFSYNIEDEGVEAVIYELCDLMGTTTSGTTETQFLNGLKTYCQQKGRSVATYSCMSGKSFNYSTAKSYIESDIPIVFFLSGYNVGSVFDHGENSDYYTFHTSDANHVMVGFGYATYDYQTSAGQVTKKFFNVSSGYQFLSYGLYDFSLNSKINDALAIQIY